MIRDLRHMLRACSVVVLLLSVLVAIGGQAWSQSLDPVRPEAFGAKGDSAADDGAALLAAAASLGSSGGIVQLACKKRYVVGHSINLARFPGLVLRGCMPAPDDPGSFRGYDGGLDTFGGILRAPGASILIGRNAGLENVIVRQIDVPIPTKTVDKFAGTAIAMAPGGAGQAALLRNVLVIGAKICFDGHDGGGRVRIDGLYCDGDTGEIIGPSADTSLITNVHNWPFATRGAAPLLRPGVGFEIRGTSDDTVLGDVFDFGHRIGFLFNSQGKGKFHAAHIWADNNADACVRFAGGRGINVASLTTYGCGVAIDVAMAAEVQISQAFIVGVKHECIRLDGTLSVSLLHLEHCGPAGGIRVVSPRSVLSIGFLHLMTLAKPWAISVPPGFTSDHVGIGKLFTDAGPGTSLYKGEGPADPVLAAAPGLDLPPNGDAFVLDGRGIVQRLRGGWNGRTVTFTTASGTAAIASGQGIGLTNGSPFGGKSGSVLVLRYDGRAALWREISRSNP